MQFMWQTQVNKVAHTIKLWAMTNCCINQCISRKYPEVTQWCND